MPVLAFSRHNRIREIAELSDRELLLQMAAFVDDVASSDPGGSAAESYEAEAALDELIRRKSQVLVNVAYRVLGDREDAKDVAQMAFVRIWDNREKYSDQWSPNTWIYRIATNLAIDHLRSRKSREKMNEPLKLELRHRQESSSAKMLSELRGQEVAGIFQELAVSLTEKQRAIFLLREVEGLASPEVAKIVGCRQSTVRNHLFNARKLLKEKLRERYPEYVPTHEVVT